MTDLIRHCGPDGSGLYALPGGRVALGHRRLSVIDLASGQQPMAEPQSGAVVVFNGEIYNYRELRASLVEDGEPFSTESDTEVLLRLYLRTGTAFLSKLRGMFAFALYDPRTGDLILARDRIGKKPLYHATVDGVLYFASTFAAVRAGAGLDHAIDPDAVYRYLNLGYVPAPFTIHPAIRKLEAGTFATVHDSEVRFRKYWDPSVSTARFSGRFEEAVDQLDELLTTATRLRLRSDVPLGVFLSGGVDSSLVSAIAARHSSSRLRTFSIGFEESGFDESGFAAEIARRIGSEHREFQSAGGRSSAGARTGPSFRGAIRRFVRNSHVAAGRGNPPPRHGRTRRRRGR